MAFDRVVSRATSTKREQLEYMSANQKRSNQNDQPFRVLSPFVVELSTGSTPSETKVSTSDEVGKVTAATTGTETLWERAPRPRDPRFLGVVVLLPVAKAVFRRTRTDVVAADEVVLSSLN